MASPFSAAVPPVPGKPFLPAKSRKEPPFKGSSLAVPSTQYNQREDRVHRELYQRVEDIAERPGHEQQDEHQKTVTLKLHVLEPQLRRQDAPEDLAAVEGRDGHQVQPAEADIHDHAGLEHEEEEVPHGVALPLAEREELDEQAQEHGEPD